MSTVPSPRPADAQLGQTAWTPLLDRLEERVRRIEAAALDETVELGPAPGPADTPPESPTADERLRMLALVATHDHLLGRLEARRRALQQARQYSLGAA